MDLKEANNSAIQFTDELQTNAPHNPLHTNKVWNDST